MLARITTMLTLLFLLSSCGIFDTVEPIPIKEESCESLRIVKFDVDMPAPLDLEQYKDIKLVYRLDGELETVTLSLEDYKKIIEVLSQAASHIERQQIIINEMKRYYEQNLDRAGVDQ